MKSMFRLATASLAVLLLSASVHAAETGYVDMGRFKPADGCEFVEVNLHSPMLKFASVFVGKEDPAVAQLLRDLKHVRVNVVGYDESTRSDTTGRVEKVRHELEAQGWSQMVTVKQHGNEPDVAIYVKMGSDDAIEGLVVTVIDSDKKQAVFVNIVGNIKPEQIAAIGKGLHIDPLARMSYSLHAKGA